MRRVIASSLARSRARSTLDAIARSSPASSRALASSTGPDGASRAPRPRARVDVDALPPPPPRATTDADAARDENDETDEMDAETVAREHAERRRAFHAARGMDALEHGGPSGPLEPTRYGDWERGGRASDF